MQKVQFYTKDHCPLCDEAYALLMMFQREHRFELEVIDIYRDDVLLEAYQLLIPAVRMNDTFLDCRQMNVEVLGSLWEKS